MANSKISQLPDAIVPLEDEDYIPVVQGIGNERSTNKVKVSDLKQSVQNEAPDLSNLVTLSTSQTISGAKVFSSIIKVDGGAELNTLYLPPNTADPGVSSNKTIYNLNNDIVIGGLGKKLTLKTNTASNILTLDLPITSGRLALTSDFSDRFKGRYTSLSALETAYPIANAGDYAQVDEGAEFDVVNYNWDSEDGWVKGGSGSAANQTDAYLLARANHTGEQAISTVTGLENSLINKANLEGDNTFSGLQTFSSFPKISAGTSGRIPYFTTGGQLTDHNLFTFDGTTFAVQGFWTNAFGALLSGNTVIGNNGALEVNNGGSGPIIKQTGVPGGNAWVWRGNTLGYNSTNALSWTTAGMVGLSQTPTTSAGGYDILTRNTSTGIIEKTPASTFLTSYNETDPIYTASSWYSTTNNAANWNAAYGWGDHASAGYAPLRDVYTKTEIQNYFGGASAMTGYNSSNWNNAFGWGDHAGAGYAHLSGADFTGAITATIAGNGSSIFSNSSSTYGQIKIGNNLTGGETWEMQSYTDGSLYFNTQANLSPLILQNSGEVVLSFDTYLQNGKEFRLYNGSNNNWSIIKNGISATQSNIEFTTGAGLALTLNHDKSAIFGGSVKGYNSMAVEAAGSDVVGSGANMFLANYGSGVTNYGIYQQLSADGHCDFWVYNPITDGWNSPRMRLTKFGGLEVSNAVTASSMEVNAGYGNGFLLNDGFGITRQAGYTQFTYGGGEKMRISAGGVTAIAFIGNLTGNSDGSTKLLSVSHPNDYWLTNTWDGNYWQLTSNHGAPVNVGRANVSDGATILQTARTLWGQSFDGSANISGELTGVTDITASGIISAGSISADGLFNSVTGVSLISTSIYSHRITSADSIYVKLELATLTGIQAYIEATDDYYGTLNKTGGTYLWTVQQSGNFAIGYGGSNADQGYKLAVNGTGYFAGYLTAAAGAGTSDIRAKELEDFNLDLSWLDTDRTIAFKFKDRRLGDRVQYGYSAQEIEAWNSDLIFDGKEKSLNQVELLTLEIKRLKQRVSELEVTA